MVWFLTFSLDACSIYDECASCHCEFIFFFFLFSDPQQTLDARGQLCMYPVHGIWPLKLFESPRT